MRRSVLVSAVVWLCLSLPASAQESDTVQYWKKKLNFSVLLNQASFSSNWTGGGVNSIGLNSSFNYQANYAKGPHSWDNEISLLYGFVRNQGQGFRKTVDRIYLDTKYGHKISEKWDIFTSLNFLSQFAQGYRYETVGNVEQAFLISDILAPAFITSAWGFEYHPTDYFNLRMAPFAPRVTIVQDPERFVPTVGPEPYGVTPPDQTRFEWLAFQLLAEFDKDLAENLNLKWRYILFANYETLDFNKIDHRLELMLSAKVHEYIDVALGGILVYDYDQVDEIQLSQLFSIGFVYKFQNYEEEEE